MDTFRIIFVFVFMALGLFLVFRYNRAFPTFSERGDNSLFMTMGLLLLIIGSAGGGMIMMDKRPTIFKVPVERNITPKEERFWRQVDSLAQHNLRRVDTVTYTYDPIDTIRKSK